MSGAVGDYRVRAQLRARLPEILIEAGSVVFALLLALAANAWHEARQAQRRGEDARRSILAEVRANEQEIRGTLASNQAVLGQLPTTVARAERDSSAELSWSMHLAQLSSAAWRTAQATQAAGDIPFDALLPISRVYELQDIYVREQLSLLDRMTGVETPSPAVLRRFMGQLSTIERLGRSLDSSYVAVLARQSPTQ